MRLISTNVKTRIYNNDYKAERNTPLPFQTYNKIKYYTKNFETSNVDKSKLYSFMKIKMTG